MFGNAYKVSNVALRAVDLRLFNGYRHRNTAVWTGDWVKTTFNIFVFSYGIHTQPE